LLQETQAFCRALGLHESLIVEIAKADNDWEPERRACSTQRAKCRNYGAAGNKSAAMKAFAFDLEQAPNDLNRFGIPESANI
jgi:hypothetical protein